MTELSESAGTGPPGNGAEGGDGAAGAQERPKLVALPEPAAEPAADAESLDAARLRLERSLSGPDSARPRSAAAAPDQPATLTPDARTPDAPRPGEMTPGAATPGALTPGTATSGTASPGALTPGVPTFATPLAIPAQPPPEGLADAIAATGTPALLGALRAELAMRAGAEAGLRIRVVDAETRLAARVLLSQRTTEALLQARAELDQLAELLTDERGRRQAAEDHVAELERELAADRDRSDDAEREIAKLRDSLAQLRTPAEDSTDAGEAGGEPQAGAGAVTPDRLNDALTRLRAITEPIDTGPGEATPSVPVPAVAPRVTLAGPFRTLCRRDPELAGRLALSLLGMERTVYPHPIAYDVVLGPGHGCIQVTSDADATEVVLKPTARPLEQIDLHVVGGPDRFAKLLVAGRLRRRLGFGVAHLRGNRDGFAALAAVLALPLDLPALVAGGMLADPVTLLSLASAMVQPEWTRQSRFAISHRDGDAPATYLLIADGRRPQVTTVAPSGPIATVISCAQADLASALVGSRLRSPAALQVLGDTAPLVQLQGWIKRAQSE
jgi:hypothetical protein